MSNISGNVTPSGIAKTSGDFQLKIVLYPNNLHPDLGTMTETAFSCNWEMGRDITGFVTEFEISEGLYQGSLIAKLIIRDGVNLLEDMRICGNEKVVITLGREEPTEDGPKEVARQKEFYISDIGNYARALGVQTYQLQLVSKLAYLSQLKVKTNAFSGSVGKSIKKILIDTGAVEESNTHYINEGGGTLKGHFSFLRPLNAINWLKRNAFDSGTPFYFFESLNYAAPFKDKIGNTWGASEADKGGMVFESYKTFVNSYDENGPVYSMKPYKHSATESAATFKDSIRILGISTPVLMPKFNQISRGAFGSTHTTVDIATKEVRNSKYQYNIGKDLMLNKYKPFSIRDEAKFSDSTLDEHQGRRFYSSLNSLSQDNQAGVNKDQIIENYSSPHLNGSNQLQTATAIEENLNFLQHEIDVYGDFSLWPGKIITIAIPKSADAQYIKDNLDTLQSGNYLVTGIKHSFKNSQYKMKLLIAKESSNLDLDSQTEAPKG